MITETLLPIIRIGVLGLAVWLAFLFVRFLMTRGRARHQYIDDGLVSEKDVARAVENFGINTNSIIHLYGDVRFFNIRNDEQRIQGESRPLAGYVSLNQQNIMITDPLCATHQVRNILLDFARATQKQNKDTLIFAAKESTAAEAIKLGFGVIQIGKEPIFDLEHYDSTGISPKIHSAVRQVIRKGVVLEEIPYTKLLNENATSDELYDVLREWFLSRKGERMQLISEVSPFKQPQYKRYFIARSENRIEGFLTCSAIPARKGYFIHDLIRRETALNGVSEALVLFALDKFKSEGVKFASLGIVPLLGSDEPGVNQDHPVLNKLLSYVFDKHETFINFKSLYHFKKKFNPTFEEPSFLLYYPPRFKFSFVIAIASMFSAHGILGDLLYKWRRWRTGSHLPRPLQGILNPEVITLTRPIPFTFREFIARCWFTCFVFFLNVYSYMNTVARGTGEIEKQILDQYGFTLSNFINNKWYVLVTSNFMHFDFWHLLANMILLIVFSATLELIGGTSLAALTYLVSINTNLFTGLFLFSFLSVFDVAGWDNTINQLDTGVTLGVLGSFGALLQFIKYKKRILLFATLITTGICAFQKNYLGIDHTFAILLGYIISYLYLNRGYPKSKFQKFFDSRDRQSYGSIVLPCSNRERKTF